MDEIAWSPHERFGSRCELPSSFPVNTLHLCDRACPNSTARATVICKTRDHRLPPKHFDRPVNWSEQLGFHRKYQTMSSSYRSRLAAAVVCSLVILVGRVSAADAPTKVLRAGAFAIDITPTKFPVSSSGSMTHRTADKAHDPLHARCLVLDNGETKIASGHLRQLHDPARNLRRRQETRRLK